MLNNLDAAVQILEMLLAAAAIWGGIRVDIRNIHSRLDRHEHRLEKLEDR